MIKYKIYYIEDDQSIAREVCTYLNGKGFEIQIIDSVFEAKKRLNSQVPALCLVDWNLPDETGGDLCKWIRNRWSALPIIFITVKNQTSDIVNGFHVGADDYMTKPFDLEILYSRISALLRRSKIESDILTCRMILVDKKKHKVLVDCEEIILSSMEFQLLLLLIENKNKTMTRKRLLELIWDTNGNFVNDNTLTVTMKRLREKLYHPDCIKTVRSIGYRMEEL